MKETEETPTPIETAIKKFQELKAKSESIRDIIYLDGVMAVLDSVKEYEKNFYSEKLKLSLPSEQEIVSISNSWCFKTTYQYPDLKSYEQGFKDALTLLTKG